jgi:hypothetical protein
MELVADVIGMNRSTELGGVSDLKFKKIGLLDDP